MYFKAQKKTRRVFLTSLRKSFWAQKAFHNVLKVYDKDSVFIDVKAYKIKSSAIVDETSQDSLRTKNYSVILIW